MERFVQSTVVFVLDRLAALPAVKLLVVLEALIYGVVTLVQMRSRLVLVVSSVAGSGVVVAVLTIFVLVIVQILFAKNSSVCRSLMLRVAGAAS